MPRRTGHSRTAPHARPEWLPSPRSDRCGRSATLQKWRAPHGRGPGRSPWTFQTASRRPPSTAQPARARRLLPSAVQTPRVGRPCSGSAGACLRAPARPRPARLTGTRDRSPQSPRRQSATGTAPHPRDPPTVWVRTLRGSRGHAPGNPRGTRRHVRCPPSATPEEANRRWPGGKKPGGPNGGPGLRCRHRE